MASVGATSPQENHAATFFKTIWGVVVAPGETMGDIVERRPVVPGLIALVVVALLDGLARAVGLGPEVAESFDITVQTPILGVSVPATPVITIALYALAAGLLWLSSRVLGGEASYAALLAGVCFIYPIFLINTAANLVLATVDFQILLYVGGATAIAALIWQFVLQVALMAQANGFSPLRSLSATVIPYVIVYGVYSGFATFLVYRAAERIIG